MRFGGRLAGFSGIWCGIMQICSDLVVYKGDLLGFSGRQWDLVEI